MSNLLVSINLVVLNGEKYIRHCLGAVLAQTYPHDKIQLNILDNGSSDNTKSIIATYNQQLTTNIYFSWSEFADISLVFHQIIIDRFGEL